MLVRDIIARLEKRVPDLSGRIEGAAAFAALLKQGALPQQTPAAHVVPAGLRGGAVSAVTGLTRQAVTETFSVVLTIRSHDRVGDGALEPLDALLPAIIAAIVGWQPPDAIDVFALTRGAVVSMSAGTLVYQLDFSLPMQLRIPADAQG